MFYKNLTFYRIKTPFPHPNDLISLLKKARFAPCLGLDGFSEGFTPIQSDSDHFTQLAGNSLAICLQREQKILPPALITDKLNAHIQHIATTEQRSIGKRERQSIRESIIDSLLPQALAKPSQIHAQLDYAHQLLLINAPSKTAEILLSKLSQALGGLIAQKPATTTPLTTLMTQWISQGEAHFPFGLDDNGTLKDEQHGATIKASKHNLADQDITQLVQHGKTVIQLGLIWREHIHFTLNPDFTLRRIRFADELLQQAQQQNDGSESLFYTQQLIQSQKLPELLNDLANLAGGWVKEST